MDPTTKPNFRDWLSALSVAAEASKALNDELGALMLEDDDSDAFIRRLIQMSERAEAAADEVANLVHIGVEIGAFHSIATSFRLNDLLLSISEDDAVERGMNRVLPTPLPNRPVDAARAAVAGLTEAQRLALATEMVLGAVLPVSIQQLRRCALAATTTADSLEKLAFAEREMRSLEGRL